MFFFFKKERISLRKNQNLFLPTAHQPLTLFALQSHTRLQVVHLHLQPLQGQVALSRLALIRNEHHHNDEDEHGACRSDADNCSATEGAVGCDVDHTRGKFDAAHTCLVMVKDRGGL